MTLHFESAEMARRLLDWYSREGRDLPWRQTRDAYRIWLSEIMLQQTTVTAVIPYYERFLQRFPTIRALAASSLDDVIGLWAGLGYYSRARNLHSAARQLVEEQGGVFPDNLAGLCALPGVGRSTAGAILAIAFDQPAPILDGNVRRVLVRLFAWTDDPRSSRAEKQLWQWAEAVTSQDRPHDYAQAIMDLGATLCTPRAPDCQRCPLQEICLACQQGLAASLPASRGKARTPLRQQVALIAMDKARLLLRQRPFEGFLGGLWEFPAVDLAPGQVVEDAAAQLRADLGLRGVLVRAGDIKHLYSHFKLTLTVFTVAVQGSALVAEASPRRWCSGPELEDLPLHGAHRKAYNLLQTGSGTPSADL